MINQTFFVNKLKQEGWESFDFGHAELHIGLSDKEMAARLLRQKDDSDPKKIKAVSSFSTKKQADRLITKAMIATGGKILRWADEARPGWTQVFRARFTYATGKGFDSRFDEKITTVVAVIIKRDSYTTNGFHVLTAYPDIESPQAEKTGRTAFDVIRQTDIFLDASPLKKAYLLFSDRNTLHLHYEKASSRGDECLTGWFNDGSSHYSILITRDSCQIHERANRAHSPEVRVPKGTLYLTNDKLYSDVKSVTDYLDVEQRKQFRTQYPQIGEQLDSILQTGNDYSL